MRIKLLFTGLLKMLDAVSAELYTRLIYRTGKFKVATPSFTTVAPSTVALNVFIQNKIFLPNMQTLYIDQNCVEKEAFSHLGDFSFRSYRRPMVPIFNISFLICSFLNFFP